MVKIFHSICRGSLIGALFFSLFNVLSCQDKKSISRTTTQNEPSQYTEAIRNYYLSTLDSMAFYLNKMDSSNSRLFNQDAYMQARKWYKYIEPIIISFDRNNYLTLNSPNLLKVKAEDYTDIKKIKPKSFQVMEEILFSEETVDKVALQLQLIFLKARAPFMAHNHILYSQRDRHYLKMIRDAVVAIATTGLSGFDSPMLTHSIQESAYAYRSIREIVKLYKPAFQNKELYKKWEEELGLSIKNLENGNFDSFDRYAFIKNHTNQQLVLINQTASDWGIQLATARALTPNATNLFDSTFLNLSHFAPPGSATISPARIALGKRLFNDIRFSKDGKMSCASCHQSSKAFTDGQTKSIGNDGKPLQRNSPTLTYAAFQRTFFFDGTASGLENQIVKVANNQKEFHVNLDQLDEVIQSDSLYSMEFEILYGGKVTDYNIRNAIATYIRSLSPFNSKFDRNMQGKEETLSKDELDGFNLFMGKAGCATCHFPPTFNGTVPPLYKESEFEKLGVPIFADFEHPGQKVDDDPGAYFPYKVEERRGFFKTPTIRNISLTAPYMHNGVYKTLEEVIHFYNVGGGAGMGLEVPYQTLPPDSLGLSEHEIEAIISFMSTLTDKRFESY